MPELTKTIAKHTTRINYITNITQLIQNTTQQINSNITQVKAQQLLTTQPELSALNTDKQQTRNETQRKIQLNTTIHVRVNVQKTKIMLNNKTKHHQMQQSQSQNVKQITLNIIKQKNVNTETTRLVRLNEDENINISATTESTLNQSVAIPMPYCKRPNDLG